MGNNKSQLAKQKALDLFFYAYKNCIAYKDFIDKSNIDFKDIKTIDDFKKIPITDKQNYIKKYPLEQRLYKDKTLSDYYMICSSSGSSGKPTFWPRDFETDKKLEKAKEALFEEHFQVSKQKTLCLITFGLGVWTAGMLSAKLSWPIAKNNKFSMVTPGIDKKSAFELIKLLHPHYDQVVLMGYPPFLTDLIDLAKQSNFDLKKVNLKLFYTSERVSEDWRNQMSKTLNTTANRHSLVGFYACSDTGIIGAETKSSIDLLEECNKNSQLNQELFSTDEPPTLVSYNPINKYLESIKNEIIITANQPVPLIRYNIHDRGKLINKNEINNSIKKFKLNLNPKETNDFYAYIFGRSDSVKITANIYADDIKYCLENSKFKSKLSGHFKYGSENTKNLRKRLKIVIYINKDQKFSVIQKEQFEKEFYKNLKKANNDFNMIQSGTNIEKFKFIYKDDDPNKYQTSKLQHFLS